jgi:hypothetical protein
MFNLMRNAQMEINVVLKDAGKSFYCYRVPSNGKCEKYEHTCRFSSGAFQFIALTLPKEKQIRWKTITRPIYDKEHCLYRTAE